MNKYCIDKTIKIIIKGSKKINMISLYIVILAIL